VVVGVDFPPMTTRCPSCGVEGSGKFCSNCGAPLVGAVCASCRAPLTPGAKFCHRCGAPAGANVTSRAREGFGNALPWAVAGIALLALVALAAGQRFARTRVTDAAAEQPAFAPDAGTSARAPDISAMSPAERAERLYDRIMSAAERGKVDSVRFFLPMALQAYESIGDLTLDQRYDLGRLAEVGGDDGVAAAQADTILRAHPDHLLGLVLASRAADLRKDRTTARRFLDRLARVAAAERRKALPEYELHRNDIETALAEQRAGGAT
jgi:hypothetical protein